MKRFVTSALISVCCLTGSLAHDAHASPEFYKKEHMQCQGYIKRYGFTWHLHANAGKPEQHHMVSNTWNGIYTEYPPSPYSQFYDWCTNIVPYGYWYLLTDCVVGGTQCRLHGTYPVTADSTQPSPCEVP